MNDDATKRLLDLNRQFYQTFAKQFSATRMRLQPGVRRVLEGIPSESDILDLGCGNGELARELARREHRGSYAGLDFSPGLLGAASETPLPDNFRFFRADLASPDWDTDISAAVYSVVLAFAVFHHLPSAGLRRAVLRQARARLAPSGRLIHSEWQFLDSPRLRARIQPWESIGLSPADLDPGDYLLDWRSGGSGLRYIHYFSEEELAALADETGFRVVESFRADGENGQLGLYQVWERQQT